MPKTNAASVPANIGWKKNSSYEKDSGIHVSYTNNKQEGLYVTEFKEENFVRVDFKSSIGLGLIEDYCNHNRIPFHGSSKIGHIFIDSNNKAQLNKFVSFFGVVNGYWDVVYDVLDNVLPATLNPFSQNPLGNSSVNNWVKEELICDTSDEYEEQQKLEEEISKDIKTLSSIIVKGIASGFSLKILNKLFKDYLEEKDWSDETKSMVMAIVKLAMLKAMGVSIKAQALQSLAIMGLVDGLHFSPEKAELLMTSITLAASILKNPKNWNKISADFTASLLSHMAGSAAAKKLIQHYHLQGPQIGNELLKHTVFAPSEKLSEKEIAERNEKTEPLDIVFAALQMI